MTKREFGNIIHEARIKKGLRLREMNLGPIRHSHIECGDFEKVLYHERKKLCEQLSLDRKEIDDACRGFGFTNKPSLGKIDVTAFSNEKEVFIQAVEGLTSCVCPSCGGEMVKSEALVCLNPDNGPWVCIKCGQYMIGTGEDIESNLNSD